MPLFNFSCRRPTSRPPELGSRPSAAASASELCHEWRRRRRRRHGVVIVTRLWQCSTEAAVTATVGRFTAAHLHINHMGFGWDGMAWKWDGMMGLRRSADRRDMMTNGSVLSDLLTDWLAEWLRVWLCCWILLWEEEKWREKLGQKLLEQKHIELHSIPMLANVQVSEETSSEFRNCSCMFTRGGSYDSLCSTSVFQPITSDLILNDLSEGLCNYYYYYWLYWNADCRSDESFLFCMHRCLLQ